MASEKLSKKDRKEKKKSSKDKSKTVTGDGAAKQHDETLLATNNKRRAESADQTAADAKEPKGKKIKGEKEKESEKSEKKVQKAEEKPIKSDIKSADSGQKSSKKEKKKKPEADSSNFAPVTTQDKSGSAYGKSGIVSKCFYKESSAVTAKSPSDINTWRKEHSVALECPRGSEYRPIAEWAEAKDSVTPKLLKACTGFAKPTAIQSQAWPVCLSGRDMIGIAKTGSGKTIAFGVPSIVHVLDQQPVSSKPSLRGPVVLVLSPTRELAMQTADVYANIGKDAGIVCSCIYGGVPKEQQRNQTKNGVHVVVATPGRLLNLIEENVLNLDRVTYLVLDEADRMLDMGFEPDIRRIVAAIPHKEGVRQTVMFSATWPKEIRELAHEFLSEPVRVTIGSEDLTASDSIKQIVEVIDMKEKDKRLIQLMQKYHKNGNRVLVFVLYKKEAPRIERLLKSKGYKVGAVHGDMSQYDRTQAVEYFKEGSQPVLVATDVCARGLDIPDVEVVINYSFPLTVEDYVHRIGRTGRGGKTGLSHTLFTIADKLLAGPLSDVLKEAGAEVPDALTKFGYAPTKKKEHKLYGSHYKAAEDMPTKKASKITFD